MPRSAHLRLTPTTPPIAVNRKVTPKRHANAFYRTREHLTPDEVEACIRAAGQAGRYGHRDAAMLTVAFRHGLRVAELCGLRWDQADFTLGLLHIIRRKGGRPGTHTLYGPEIRALRRLKREQQPASSYIFTSERHGPVTPDGVRKIVARAGALAGLPFTIHPHMLRHACGYKLAADHTPTREIQQHLGHQNIGHTVRYTTLTPGGRYWKD